MMHQEVKMRKPRLTESVGGTLDQDLMTLYIESKKILNDFEKFWNLNLKLLSTWGAALGGIMLPIKNWIEQKYPDLSYEQVILVLMGSIIGFFYDNDYFINTILKKIKKEGLLNELKSALLVSQKLMNSLNSLLEKMHFNSRDNVDYVSFAFVLPILDDLKKTVSQENLDELTKKIISSGVVLSSSSKVRFFLSKLLQFA